MTLQTNFLSLFAGGSKLKILSSHEKKLFFLFLRFQVSQGVIYYSFLKKRESMSFRFNLYSKKELSLNCEKSFLNYKLFQMQKEQLVDIIIKGCDHFYE